MSHLYHLYERLTGVSVKGIRESINLYTRFQEIKKDAKKWLENLGKNGYEHSERLEEYLDALTRRLCENGRLMVGEVFVLLCAAYMHDLGYRQGGRCVAEGHQKRSHDLILGHPETYLLGDFPCMQGSPPRVAEAVGWVCYGHSEEKLFPLKEVPNDFADQALSKEVFNLRKLAALLRITQHEENMRNLGFPETVLREPFYPAASGKREGRRVPRTAA